MVLQVLSPLTIMATDLSMFRGAKVRTSGYWKFNAIMLNEKDFQNQLELILKRELMDTIIGNSQWDKLTIIIRSFAAGFNGRFKVEKLAVPRSVEAS